MTLTSRQIHKSIAVSMICTSVVGITMGLTWPLLTLILDSKGVSDSLIGLSSASQSVAVLFVAPFAPRLISAYGVTRVVAVSIVSTIVCLALLPIYVDVYVWFPIRLALGAGVSLLFIAGETWINHMAPAGTRGRVIGVFGFLWSAGFAVAPLIINVTGIEGWAPFLAGIMLVALAGASLPLARGLSPTIEPAQTYSLRKLFWLAPAALFAAPILGSIDSINDSLLALYGIRNGLNQERAIYVLTILFLGTTIGHIPFGWLADYCSQRALLVWTTLSTLVLTACIPIVITEGWSLWLVIFLWGAALGGIWTAAIVLLGQRCAGAQLAAANSLYTALYGLGSVIGPALGGFMMDTWSPLAVPVLIAAFLLIYLPMAFLANKGTTN